MPLVTIVMPAYNVEQYISNSIKSVIKQTFIDWELIIINDGSTDRTDEVIDSFIALDNRITVLFQENSGVAAARNRGLALAKGQYISFLDADDIYDSTYLEKMSDGLRFQSVGFAFCMFKKIQGNVILSETPQITFEYQNFPLYLLQIKRHAYAAMATMFDRDLIMRNNLWFTEGCILGEDSEFVMKVASLGESVFVPESLYFYIYRDESASHQAITYQHIFDHYNSYERAKQFILTMSNSPYRNLYQKHIESTQNSALNNLRRAIWRDIQKGDFDAALNALNRYGKPLKIKGKNFFQTIGSSLKLWVINSHNKRIWKLFSHEK